MIQRRSITMLPEAQINRQTQQKVVYDLAEAGFLVKSGSYFSDATWRSETEIMMFALADRKVRRLNDVGEIVWGPEVDLPPATSFDKRQS